MMDEIVAKIVSEFSPGDLITHDYLYLAFQIADLRIEDFTHTELFVQAFKNDQFKYMGLVNKLRDELLEKEFYYLKNIRGDGYVLLPPKEQVKFAYDTAMTQIQKEFCEAKNIMLNCRTDVIPPEQIAKNHDLIARLSNLQQVFRKEK